MPQACTHTHTHTHLQTQTCTQTCTHRLTNTQTYAQTHTCTQTHTDTHLHRLAHTCTDLHTHTDNTYRYTNTHARTHRFTHTHTHTHTRRAWPGALLRPDAARTGGEHRGVHRGARVPAWSSSPSDAEVAPEPSPPWGLGMPASPAPSAPDAAALQAPSATASAPGATGLPRRLARLASGAGVAAGVGSRLGSSAHANRLLLRRCKSASWGACTNAGGAKYCGRQLLCPCKLHKPATGQTHTHT